MSKKLWGGRFSKKTDPLMEKFTRSIDYDYKLAGFDCLGSTYHAMVLKRSGLITAKEAEKLTKGLKDILKAINKGTFKADMKAEDIHSVIQNALKKKIGALALKLQTSRSRNEQVAFDVKLYCLENILKTLELSSKLIKGIFNLAAKNKALVLPGYTHLQHAEPLKAAFYLGSYVEMLKRDNKRLTGIGDSIELTFGAGALAGTNISAAAYNIAGLPFNKTLKPTRNPVDSVSDRDFVLEALSALAITGMHLSRIAEDLIIWSTAEFGFIELDDAFCTGSSLMPQKKNPDALELIRGYAGRLSGNFTAVFTMMKGLPMAYNRDMQLDKEPLFNSFEIVQEELEILERIISTLRLNRPKIEKQLEDESLYATGIAHYLVKKGMASRAAHDAVGRLVAYSVSRKKKIKDMTDKEIKNISGLLDRKNLIGLMDPERSVKSKISIRS